MKNIKVFLDDIRDPVDCASYMYHRIGKLNPIYLEEWVVVRNFDQFVETIQGNTHLISHISFDHDLADEHYDESMVDPEKYNKLEFKAKTGYDCAKWLKEYYEAGKLDLPVMFVHSMNPVGSQNIINLFT